MCHPYLFQIGWWIDALIRLVATIAPTWQPPRTSAAWSRKPDPPLQTATGKPGNAPRIRATRREPVANWPWNGTRCGSAPPTGPPPRSFHAAASATRPAARSFPHAAYQQPQGAARAPHASHIHCHRPEPPIPPAVGDRRGASAFQSYVPSYPQARPPAAE